MPFSASCTVRRFDRASIEALNPDQLGVYGIFREGQWIYVGRGDIRSRMLDHLNGDIPCIQANRATSWVAELSNTPKARERELILELSPVCNQRVG